MTLEKDGRPYIDIVNFYPDNFFDKHINEEFIQNVMRIALQIDDWREGNANYFEQDRLCGTVPFEFTIASDSRRKNTFVQKMKTGKYVSEDIDKDMFEYISTALDKKAQKEYSKPNTHLSILCIEELTSWVFDEYGVVSTIFVHDRREEFFSKIKMKYIESGIFNNIFIIFPDIFAKWWVWDVKTNKKVSIQLLENDILSEKIPFVMEKSAYNEIISKARAKEI